jgi:hypothetical protein
MLERNKNSTENVSDERAIDAFVLGLRRSDLIEELRRIKPRTVSELMEIASRFVDGEDAYHNKRARSPEHDRSNRYNNQRCRSHNDDGHNPRNQVAAGIREAAKKEASEGTTGTAEEMTQEEINQETLTRHPRISSMDHATYITHTSTGRGFPIT